MEPIDAILIWFRISVLIFGFKYSPLYADLHQHAKFEARFVSPKRTAKPYSHSDSNAPVNPTNNFNKPYQASELARVDSVRYRRVYRRNRPGSRCQERGR
ncbi:hypothetical protein EV2_035372 [Malus domestica]